MANGFSSIYQKVCPQCMAGNAQDAVQCACGHHFETAQAPMEQALEDEKLYETYLAARADQARQEFECAKKVYELDPKDGGKKAAVARTREAWETAQAEAEDQRKRIEALSRAIASTIKTPAPVTQPAKTEATVRPGTYVHPVPKLIRRTNPPDVAAAKQLKTNHATAAPKPPEPQSKTSAAKPEPKKVVGGGVAAPRCPDCGKALNGDQKCGCQLVFGMSEEMAQRYPSLYQAYLQGKNTESGGPAKPEQPGSNEGSKTAKAIAPGANPAPSVRATQVKTQISAPVEKCQPSQLVTTMPEPTRAPCVPQQHKQADTKPAAAARPAREAEPAAVQQVPTKECPHCTAVLPVAAKGCKCGMTFPEDGQVTAMPGLALGPAEVTQPAKAASTKECPHCTAVLPVAAKGCKCGMTFPENGQVTVMPGLSLGPGEVIRLLDLYRR